MRKHAVIVGINDYSGNDSSEKPNLSCCVADATSMGQRSDSQVKDLDYVADCPDHRCRILPEPPSNYLSQVFPSRSVDRDRMSDALRSSE
jgi:hypothetical protein